MVARLQLDLRSTGLQNDLSGPGLRPNVWTRGRVDLRSVGLQRVLARGYARTIVPEVGWILWVGGGCSGAGPGIHPNYYRTVWNVGHSGIPARTTVPELIRHKFISTKGCLA